MDEQTYLNGAIGKMQNDGWKLEYVSDGEEDVPVTTIEDANREIKNTGYHAAVALNHKEYGRCVLSVLFQNSHDPAEVIYDYRARTDQILSMINEKYLNQ